LKRIVKKHPLVIRWAHWLNFPVLGVMIWSGMMIYWANDIYRIGFGDTTILKFFPDSFYSALNLDGRLADGMALHFLFMWLFFVNGFIYVLYSMFSGEWKYLVPNRYSFKQAWHVVLYDLRIRKIKPPHTKYNAAQRVAYSSVIVMGLGSLLTGLAVYKPTQLHLLCTMLGGYEAARVEHFILTIGYVLFFVVHIVQVIIAGWNNFRAMVTGFEVETITPPPPAEEPEPVEQKPPVA
jgi:thiosulfate reductase cytochrome b subunit